LYRMIIGQEYEQECDGPVNNISDVGISFYYHHFLGLDHFFTGHRHLTHEFNALLSGEMQMICDDKIYHMKKGDFLLQPAHSFHKNCVLGETTAQLIVVNFTGTDDDYFKKQHMGSMDADSYDLLKLFCSDMERNAHIENGRCVEISRTAIKLFEVYLDYISNIKNNIQNIPDEKSVIYSNAVRFMGQHLTESLTISDIAKACKVCQTTLKNVFSSYTNKGCIEYFGEMKMVNAKRMLLEGSSCAEVSESLGFSSQAYFTRRFKQMYGVTPTDFKKRGDINFGE